jgi:hypothetical protein
VSIFVPILTEVEFILKYFLCDVAYFGTFHRRCIVLVTEKAQ